MTLSEAKSAKDVIGSKVIKEFTDRIKSKVIFDEETGLFYGVGLNEIVDYSKNQNSLKMVDFGEEVSTIMQKLSFFNKDELLFLHRYILARVQRNNPNLRQKAKMVLIDAITQEVLNQKSNNKRGKSERSLVRSLLDQSVWDSLLVFNTKGNQAELEDTLKRVSQLSLPEEKVDMIAMFLAKQKVKSILKDKATSNNRKLQTYYNPKIPGLFAQDPIFPGQGNFNLSMTLNDIARELESWNTLVVEKPQDIDSYIQTKITDAYFKYKLQLLANNGLPDFETAAALKQTLSEEPEPDLLTHRTVTVKAVEGKRNCHIQTMSTRRRTQRESQGWRTSRRTSSLLRRNNLQTTSSLRNSTQIYETSKRDSDSPERMHPHSTRS